MEPNMQAHRRLGRAGWLIISGVILVVIVGAVFAIGYYVSHRTQIENTGNLIAIGRVHL